MAKKRRRKHRSRRSNPKKRTHRRRKHRRNVAAPKRRRRTHRRRARRSNPRRRHRVRGHFAKRRGRRHRVRAHVSNPRKRRTHRRRARRRNPGGFTGQIAFALLAALAGFAGTFALGYFVTPAAQMAEKGQLYRGGVGVLGAGAGVYVAKKHPLVGIGLAIGSLLGAFGGFITLKLLSVLPPKAAAPTTTKGLGAVFNDNMQAVFNDNMSGYAQQMSGYQQQMGAVFNDNMSGYQQQMGQLGMGDAHDDGEFAPAAPWQTATPFDARGY